MVGSQNNFHSNMKILKHEKSVRKPYSDSEGSMSDTDEFESATQSLSTAMHLSREIHQTMGSETSYSQTENLK